MQKVILDESSKDFAHNLTGFSQTTRLPDKAKGPRFETLDFGNIHDRTLNDE